MIKFRPRRDRLEVQLVIDVVDRAQYRAALVQLVLGVEAAVGLELVEMAVGRVEGGVAGGIATVKGAGQGQLHVPGRIQRDQAQLATVGLDVDVVDVLVARAVVHGAIAGQANGREAAEQGVVHQRPADQQAAVLRVVVACTQLDEGAGLLRRVAGNHPYRAGCAVAPIQRALRAAQHFDALDIVEVQHRGNRPRDVQVIGVHRDRGFLDRVGFTDAADAVGLRAVGDGLAVQRQVGHTPGQVADVVDLRILQGALVEGADCQRGFLQVLFTVLGRDGDGWQLVAGFPDRLCKAGGGEEGKCNGGGQVIANRVGLHATASR
ncbi:hypothetical protein D3C81_958910 [compost metagenome]